VEVPFMEDEIIRLLDWWENEALLKTTSNINIKNDVII